MNVWLLVLLSSTSSAILVEVQRSTRSLSNLKRDAQVYLAGGPLKGGCWSMQITVGPVVFPRVLIDSGSSDLVIPAIGINELSGNLYYNYDGKIQYGPDVSSGYADGSSWTGGFFYDNVGFGGVSTRAPFAAMKHQNPSHPVCDGISNQGIFGIAYDGISRTQFEPRTVFSAYVAQLGLNNVISFRGCSATSTSPSFVDFGNQNDALSCITNQSPLGWATIIAESYYVVDVVGVAVSGIPVAIPPVWQQDYGGSIVDSCTTLLVLPSAIYTAFTTAIVNSNVLQNAGMSNAMVNSFVFGFTGIYAAYFPINFAALPTISFTLDSPTTGTITLTLSGYNYIQPDGSGYLFFPIGTGGSSIMFGGVFFEEYYIVFDRMNKRIGFGPGCDCGLPSMAGKIATVSLGTGVSKYLKKSSVKNVCSRHLALLMVFGFCLL